MKSAVFLLKTLAIGVLCGSMPAHAIDSVAMGDANKAQLVIYSDQQALVNQPINIPKNKGKPVMLTGLSNAVDLGSLQVEGAAGEEAALQWQDQELSPARVLSTMQGHRVELYGSALQHPEVGTLISWNNGYSLVETDTKQQYLVRDTDPNLRIRLLEPYPKQALGPIITFANAPSSTLNIDYRLHHISYQMHYRMRINLATQKATLQQQATVRNGTKQYFKQAKVTLAIGDRGRAYEPTPRMMLASARATDGANGSGASTSALRYLPVAHPMDLPAYSAARVAMAHWSDIAVTQSLQLKTHLRSRSAESQVELPQRIISWKAPALLAAGALSLYETDTQGHLRLSSSGNVTPSAKDFVTHTPLGRVYQVPVTLTRLSNTQSNGVNQQKWQLKVQNSTQKPVLLDIQETDAQLLELSGGKVKNNGTVQYSVPAHNTKTFTLTARYDDRAGR